VQNDVLRYGRVGRRSNAAVVVFGRAKKERK